MDEITYTLLKKMHLEYVQLISLENIESVELLQIKKTRTRAEFSWTCKPLLIQYVINKVSDSNIVTYLDADLYFFANPQPIYQEFGNNSIGITPHRFPPEKEHMKKKTGLYNAGFIVIRRDDSGLQCLAWYSKKCLEWCFFRYENGKIGDQGYLDEWPKSFSRTHTFTHHGINAAPWNIKNYSIQKISDKIHIDSEPLICYHFHSLHHYEGDKIQLYSYGYSIKRHPNLNLIYQPYLTILKQVAKQINMIDPSFNYALRSKPTLIQKIKRTMLTISPSLRYLKK